MSEAFNDYDRVAAWYDQYVRATTDLDFFRETVDSVGGPVLELMAGTGRVTRGLTGRGSPVTCVDRSREMLGRLRAGVTGGADGMHVICGDVYHLPVRTGYRLVLIPFNSFGELVTLAAQRRTVTSVARVLEPAGRFVVTLHNPVVRTVTLDGMRRSLGPFALEGGRSLEVTMVGSYAPDTGLAQSCQEYRVVDARGAVEESATQCVSFALVEPGAFRDLVADRFDVVSVFGDYDRSPFDAARSPFMIWELEPR